MLDPVYIQMYIHMYGHKTTKRCGQVIIIYHEQRHTISSTPDKGHPSIQKHAQNKGYTL